MQTHMIINLKIEQKWRALNMKTQTKHFAPKCTKTISLIDLFLKNLYRNKSKKTVCTGVNF